MNVKCFCCKKEKECIKIDGRYVCKSCNHLKPKKEEENG